MRVWIRRMSLGRRIELARQVRDLAGKLEYHEASEKVVDRVEAALIGAEIDAAYLRWGVLNVDGFEIDGVAATAQDLISAAPEALVREIVARIKRECGLTDAERKN
jgi:hypothetical protein